MLIVKGCLLVFGLAVVLLILVSVLGRGVMFPARLLPWLGMLLIGAGIGTTAIGCGFLYLGKVASAHFAAVMRQ